MVCKCLRDLFKERVLGVTDRSEAERLIVKIAFLIVIGAEFFVIKLIIDHRLM